MLRNRSGRYNRYKRDVNHCLTKAIVNTAKGTSRGIALEDLQGIRARAKGTVKRQRRVLHSWSFFQLRAFIAYKAALAGVQVVYINPAFTSQTCSACGQGESSDSIAIPLSFLWVLRSRRCKRGSEHSCSRPGGCHSARRGGPHRLVASSWLRPVVDDQVVPPDAASGLRGSISGQHAVAGHRNS